MEAILGESLPPIGEFEENLRNGVLLARVAQKFEPSVVRKIHTAEKLEFKHSDNINYVFTSYKKIGLPPVFDFELTADEMKQIASLDQKQSQFFDHHDPAAIKMLKNL